jgi:hypothetical protein
MHSLSRVVKSQGRYRIVWYTYKLRTIRALSISRDRKNIKNGKYTILQAPTVHKVDICVRSGSIHPASLAASAGSGFSIHGYRASISQVNGHAEDILLQTAQYGPPPQFRKDFCSGR